ncbi:hypothetical protein HY251_02510 [bacterium]|nr:hypothetical protein [bacterium]
MKFRFPVVAVLAVALGAVSFPPLRGRVEAEDTPAKPATARTAFERLKKNAGDWVLPDDPSKVAFSWKVVSGGSVAVETLFPGGDHEMITVYFMDGEDLVCTHYCAMKNQPHLKAEGPFDGSTIKFRFASGTNVNPEKDRYMGDLELTLGDDTIKSVWGSFSGKERQGSKEFQLKRKK